MNNNLMIFEERKVLGKDFRIYGNKENPLFLAKDVAEWIDYSFANKNKGIRKVSQMLQTVDKEEKILGITNVVTQNQQGGLRENTERWFLTEDGVYEILMQSRKPIAKQFKKEVKNILKQIRKTGGAVRNEEEFIKNYFPSFSDEVKQAMVLDLREQNEKYKAIVQKQQPKVVIADRFTSCNGYIEIKSFVKMLDIPKMGRTNFFKWLRGKEILMEDNIPYQRYSDYFKVINMMGKDNRWHKKTVIKYSGIEYIVKKLIKDNYIEKMDYNKILERFDKEIKNNVA